MPKETLDFTKALKARLAWDLIPDEKVVAWSDALGISPAHPDVATMERLAADRRRNHIAPLYGTVEMLTSLATDTAIAGILRTLIEQGEVDPRVEIPAAQLPSVVLPIVRAVINQLLDMGALHTVHGASE